MDAYVSLLTKYLEKDTMAGNGSIDGDDDGLREDEEDLEESLREERERETSQLMLMRFVTITRKGVMMTYL